MKRLILNYMVCGLFVAFMVLCRPGVLGEYGTLSIVPASFLLLFCIFLKNGIAVLRLTGGEFLTILAFILYWAFRLIQKTTYSLPFATDMLVKSAGIEIISLLVVFALLRDVELKEKVGQSLALFYAIMGLSSFTSFLLAHNGFGERISVFQFMRGPADSMVFTFQYPFSILYAEYNGLSSIPLYRYTSGCIEAGVYPAFAAWAIILVVNWTSRWRYLVFAGCVLGTVVTFSTTGLFCLSFALLGAFVIRIWNSETLARGAKILVLALCGLLVPLCVLAFLYAPDIGLMDKAFSHSESMNDRGDNIRDGLLSLSSNFTGIYSSEKHRNICLLAASYGLGLIGLLLWLLKATTLILTRRSEFLLAFLALTPLLFTLLFSQPLYDAMPGVLLVLGWTYRSRLETQTS